MMWTEHGVTGSSEKDVARTWHFSKTKMCKFELVGMCSKGPECPFAHAKIEMRPLPDLTRTKLCKTLIDTGVCNNMACTYAHNKVELRTTSAYHKTKLCRFSLMGHCALGSKCNFAHSADELKPTDSTTEDNNAQSTEAYLYGHAGAVRYPPVAYPQYLPSASWANMRHGIAAEPQPAQGTVKVGDVYSEFSYPPGLEPLTTSNPSPHSKSPARIPLSSDNQDGPLYVTLAPRAREDLLSPGDYHHEPAFISPLRTIRSAGGLLADLDADSRCPDTKVTVVTFGSSKLPIEVDDTSTPSSWSPRGSEDSTDNSEDTCQAESSSLVVSYSQKNMESGLLAALSLPEQA